MPYFLQLDPYYKPQEFNNSDLQKFNAVAVEFQKLDVDLLPTVRSIKLHELQQQLEELAPITISLKNIDQALRRALHALMADANDKIVDLNHNIAQATAIKEVCTTLLGELNLRPNYQPVTIAELDQISSKYSALEELTEGDLATWYMGWLRAIIHTHHLNLGKIYEPTFDVMAKEVAYLGSPAEMHFGTPYAPPISDNQDALYPTLEQDSDDERDPYARASAPAQVEYNELVSDLDAMKFVAPDEVEIPGGLVRTHLEKAREKALTFLSPLADTDAEFQRLWAVASLCDTLENKVAKAEIITMKLIEREIAKVADFRGAPDSKVHEILNAFKNSVKPIEVNPASRPAVAAAVASAPSRATQSGSLYGGLFAEARDVSMGLPGRKQAVSNLVAALDTYITERALLKDSGGKTMRYAHGGAGLLLANVFGGQNEFSAEEKAVHALKAKLQGDDVRFSEAEIAAFKLTFSRGGPLNTLRAFIQAYPLAVSTILGKPVDSPKAFMEMLFSSEFDQQFAMIGRT